ncbi:lipoprotein-releasing ABC transporter permease subunit [Thiohalobacter thiocyanaticus]|uniref:Lipoprotein-releasing ABC transporter permease subunit n=1 Tax=Thiohalobacter thiocyanaticus TaxID=585455 RepID=A0A426QFT8_9GAMM|nr:lipoprotein-releasing ABC transporter permease subunit [Thiohalobacter thiocyanaticus]RRQ20615.1 lipoprotein-releasing ABC transporter permease subunit [Thiohalobacter thiocyanaticus]
MFRPYEIFIGLRYTRAKRRNHFISFISLVSILGIALGVTALITVLSVMNGFENELRTRILGMASHATVTSAGGGIDDWQGIMQTVTQHPDVVGAAPFVRGEAMLALNERVSGAMLRGILPGQEGAVSDVGAHMKLGRLEDLRPGEYGIVLGSELAYSMGVRVGDRITVISPQATVTVAGALPRLRRFTVVGLFEVGMYEYDRGVALVHMQDAAKLFRLNDQVSGVRLKLRDLFEVKRVVHELSTQLPVRYRLSDWTREHHNFFRAIQTEKRVMFVILALIVAVAAFNIVSTLVMVVTDKQSDIAILRTLGSTPGSVMAIFTIQGLVIGVLGTLLGMAGGIGLALNVETLVPAIERLFQVEFLPADVYYISDLPSDLNWPDVWHISSVAFLLSLLATLYPAWRASRTQPAEALRYE